MTRTEIEQFFSIDPESGTVCNPGTFEGEMLYVPHFWYVGLDGFADVDEADENGDWYYGFEITDEDRAEFPELGDAEYIRVHQNSSGFVYAVFEEGQK